ncbi:unknown [Parabacteroides johnsonii CAG:246]|nr:unknown [Parabacteroides johnsonii CAG:246]
MGIHIDIVHLGIHFPFFLLVKERGGTQRDVRLIQLRFRCDTGIIRTVDRSKDGSSVNILLETDAFVKRGSCVEEGIDIIICPERHLASEPVRHHLPFRFRSPAQARLVIIDSDRSLSETVLHIRFQENGFSRNTGIHRNPQPFVFPSRFGRDQDHAITSPRTVKSSSRGSFQDRHRFDVFRIDI